MHVRPNDHQALTRDLIAGLRAVGAALVVVPRVAGIDWTRVAADPTIPLIITNRPSQAYRLCAQGQPAIAVMGASKRAVAKWFRKRGARAHERRTMQ